MLWDLRAIGFQKRWYKICRRCERIEIFEIGGEGGGKHLGDMGGEGDVRDIVEIGIGTCLTVFLVTVTSYWLSDLVT